jgi:hypothetical protein
MLIHRQNSHVPRGKRRTGCREAQSRELVNKLKKLSAQKLPLQTISVCHSGQTILFFTARVRELTRIHDTIHKSSIFSEYLCPLMFHRD